MRHSARRIITAASLAALVITEAAACSSGGGGSSANNIESRQQGIDSKAIEFAEPLPYFANSEIRQELIDIEAIQALGIRSTTFAFNQGIRDPVWSCPSIGLPVPVTDQLSNPQQIVNDGGQNAGYYGTAVPIGQMDPNGIYQGDSTGTNVLCVGKNGTTYAHYAEEFADAVTASAHWDYTTHSEIVTGTPVMPVCKLIVRGKRKKQTRTELCTDPTHTSAVGNHA
jgi:hypothetical protein